MSLKWQLNSVTKFKGEVAMPCCYIHCEIEKKFSRNSASLHVVCQVWAQVRRLQARKSVVFPWVPSCGQNCEETRPLVCVEVALPRRTFWGVGVPGTSLEKAAHLELRGLKFLIHGQVGALTTGWLSQYRTAVGFILCSSSVVNDAFCFQT